MKKVRIQLLIEAIKSDDLDWIKRHNPPSSDWEQVIDQVRISDRILKSVPYSMVHAVIKTRPPVHLPDNRWATWEDNKSRIVESVLSGTILENFGHVVRSPGRS